MARIDYFCGSQANIVVGGHVIDECYSIQFELVTNRTPIYGYASHRFDSVLEGNILVSGILAINFIHPNYLIASISAAQQLRLADFNKSSMEKAEKWRDKLHPYEFMGEAKGKTIKNASTFERVNALRQAMNLGREDYASWHNTMWHQMEAKASESEGPAGSFNGVTDSRLKPDSALQKFYETPAFDVHVILGEDPTSSPFEVGDPTAIHSARQGYELHKGAKRILSNVILTSSGQTITASGEPILETYRFLARDLF
jgi:hypothetical protein